MDLISLSVDVDFVAIEELTKRCICIVKNVTALHSE